MTTIDPQEFFQEYYDYHEYYSMYWDSHEPQFYLEYSDIFGFLVVFRIGFKKSVDVFPENWECIIDYDKINY